MKHVPVENKFKTIDSNSFIGQCCFDNNGVQLYVIFQAIYKIITTFSGLKDTISEWISKELSNKNLRVLIQQM